MIISYPKDRDLPIPISNVFGDFKHEIPRKSIKNFYALGPKNYSITYLDKDGQCKTDIKTRGFYWKNNADQDKVDESCYEEFLKALLENNEEKRRLIPQFNIKIDKKTSKLFSTLNMKSYNNLSYTKRVLYQKGSANYMSYSVPFGFTSSILEEAQEICKNMKLK